MNLKEYTILQNVVVQLEMSILTAVPKCPEKIFEIVGFLQILLINSIKAPKIHK